MLETTLTFSSKKITSEVQFTERKSGLLQNNKVWKKYCPLFSYKVTRPLHHPKNDFMSKWHLIQPLQRETYKNQRLSPRFSFGAKIFGHVSHSSELVRMCLAYQDFDFNSPNWFSDNLHVISSWYLRMMGKEFPFGSADVSGAGTRDEPLRKSAWQATLAITYV